MGLATGACGDRVPVVGRAVALDASDVVGKQGFSEAPRPSRLLSLICWVEAVSCTAFTTSQ